MTQYKITKSADLLCDEARSLSGIRDIEDKDIVEPLTVFLESLNTEAALSAGGARAMEERLLKTLANRLRMLRDFRDHPEIEEQQIRRPVILTGAGRTGSTKLHKLLAASGDFISMPFWQGYELGLRTGNRHEDPMPRIADAKAHVTWFNEHAPDSKLIHEYGAEEVEEETLLMEHGNFGTFMLAFVFAPGFIEWAASRFPDTMAFVKKALKYLQWQFHDGDERPWVLKCPIYFGMEPLLGELFPDALFVATHRDPLETMSSQASLLHAYHKAYSDQDRREILGAMMLEGQVIGSQMFMDSRDANPDLNTLDVSYPDLTRSSENVVSGIYARAGLDLREPARRNLAAWETENRQHKHGSHRHQLSDFGLNEELVRERLSSYRTLYKPYF